MSHPRTILTETRLSDNGAPAQADAEPFQRADALRTAQLAMHKQFEGLMPAMLERTFRGRAQNNAAAAPSVV
jgi:hypothetical protein